MVWHKWGEGPCVVLVHGGFGSWNHWCRNVMALSREFTVIAPDLPGLGDSDEPDNPSTAEHIGEILADGLERVIPAGAGFHIGCFSYGAVPGSVAAVRHGNRVRSFTLVGAAGFGPRERPTDGLIRILPEMDEATRRATAQNNLAVLMFADPRNVDDLAIDIQLVNTARARFRSRPLSLSDTVLRNLPQISARRNAIWGSEDITAKGMLPQRNAAIKAADPDAQIVVMDGIGHWVQYEAADAFNECYLGMLKQTP
ncbi:alpha/beta fold hydrolase [Nisaea nitritireducens]|uniref:alpha/beta fold hydrolase n=1 Tax=Nisaea nitritireducens TaxID=568392 RepID=UPI001D010408|nr:alpha/beta fold hydrolase [Nisaea nitritireducens]